MKKACKRKKGAVHAPTMIALHLNPEVSLQERFAVKALKSAYASTGHFNVLLDCWLMLHIAAEEKGEDDVQAISEVGQMALDNIRDRWERTTHVGATGDELKALETMVDFSEDYWKRQGGKLFAEAYFEMDRRREVQRKEAQVNA
jgi:hypothetical protein